MLSSQQEKKVLSCFIFDGMDTLPYDLKNELEPITFPAGSDIYTELYFDRSVGIIVGGSASVFLNGTVEVHSITAGNCFGVAALFGDDSSYVSTVRAKTKCDVVFIGGTQVSKLLKTYPQIAINYITFLSDRVRFLNRMISRYAVPNTSSAVQIFLLSNAVDGEIFVESYAALARKLNIGRASLYRILGKMESDGYILRDEKRIVIHDIERLSKAKL